MTRQLSLFEPKLAKSYSFHGLTYSLAPVASWIEAENLIAFKTPYYDIENTIRKVWVDPTTVKNVARFKYPGFKGISWGRGPKKIIGKNKVEFAEFTFTNPRDRWFKRLLAGKE